MTPVELAGDILAATREAFDAQGTPLDPNPQMLKCLIAGISEVLAKRLTALEHRIAWKQDG